MRLVRLQPAALALLWSINISTTNLPDVIRTANGNLISIPSTLKMNYRLAVTPIDGIDGSDQKTTLEIEYSDLGTYEPNYILK